jgi:bacillithiol biosynthesis cysteine-adding enzyme BshC
MKAAICDPIRRGWFILEGKLAESINWSSLPNVARVMVELAAGRREIVALLGGDWRLGDVRRAAAERRVRFHSQPGLGQLIRKGYGDRNSSLPPALEKNLRALDKPDTLAIVTGQQVGIFGGPLYTFYKAYTTILLAEALKPEAPGEVVPVFWMETSDADFGEVNRVCFPLEDDNPRRAVYTPRDAVAGKAIGYHVLGEEINGIRETVTGWMADAPFHTPLTKLITEIYQPGRLLADAFHDLLTSVFGSRGLVMFNPLQSEAAPRTTEFWERSLQRPEHLNKAFQVASSEVQALRLPLQVKLRDDALPIMHVDETGIRRRIHGTPGNWTIGADGPGISLEELQRLPHERPGALSPSALLRPLLQDWLLPTWIYVGGPAEVSYQAQIGRAYDLLDMPRPMVAPRVTATIVERPQRRILDKHGWKVMDALGGRELLLRRQGRSEVVEGLFESGSDQLKGWLERIERMADETGINIAAELDKSGRKLIYQWDKLHRAVTDKLTERDRVRVSHAQNITDHLMPDGIMQERHDNFLYYLANYGDRLMDIIRAEANPFQTQHLAIDLEPA